MQKRYSLTRGWIIVLSLISFSVICSGDTSHANEAAKVLILPFDIHGSDTYSYLASEIPKVIGEHLKQEGAVLLLSGSSLDAASVPGERSPAAIRERGAQEGADFVIWGNVTWIDGRFVLEAKLMASLTSDPPEAFVRENEGIENLPGTVSDLAADLSARIFKRAEIADVSINGNQRIEADAIKRVIKAAPGQAYIPLKIPEDIKAIYAMGYFDDIRADVKDVPEGKAIVFTVKEKPTIRQILISGNRAIEIDDIMESIDISPGSILNTFKVKANIDAVKELYSEENYHNAVVTYSVRPLKDNQADLLFAIEEGKRLLVKQIIFVGNSSYTDKQLKGLMKTSEKGVFSWITSSGNLKTDELEEDAIRLRGHYHRTGYMEARIDGPQIEYKEEWIYITIKIDEGPRFKVGRVDVAGDLIAPKADMLKLLAIAEKAYIDREILQADTLVLTDLYADQGYAYANIKPTLGDPGTDNRTNITYRITSGKKVYLERVTITGNSKTRDNVIRREMVVQEGKLYNGTKLKESIRNLNQLGLFEDVKFETSRGSDDDRMVVNIEVEERSTTAFFFGGAYSEVDGFYGQLALEERNLFGRGQHLRIIGQTSDRDALYQLSFMEPRLFDMPLAAGVEIYNLEQDYDFYQAKLRGIILQTGYLITDDTRVFLSYKYETDKIETMTFLAPQTILLSKRDTTNSSVAASIRYNSVDNLFSPREGTIHALTVQYAGLGGDIGYIKYIAESGAYVPLYKRLVFFAHAKGGYIQDISGFSLPDYERFYLGGMDSLRGYDWRDISPTEINPFGFESIIGGVKYVQFNFELLLPVMEKTGANLLVFYDAGDVYDDHESIDLGNLRQSIGFGFRWFSPMGPVRLEYAYPLDTEPGDISDGHFEFAVGFPFSRR